MAEFVFEMLLGMLSTFIGAWQNESVPRSYLLGTLLTSLGLPVLAVALSHPIVRALCWGGTGLAWTGFIAVLVIGNSDHEKSPGA